MSFKSDGTYLMVNAMDDGQKKVAKIYLDWHQGW